MEFDISFDKQALEEFVSETMIMTKEIEQAFLDNIADEILAEAQRYIRQGGPNFPAAFDTGTLARSGVVVTPDSNTRIVGFSTKPVAGVEYADVVHEGRASGIPPPFKPIFAWTKRKKMSNPKKAAWAIVNKIKKEGIIPKPYLEAAIFKVLQEADTIAALTLKQFE